MSSTKPRLRDTRRRSAEQAIADADPRVHQLVDSILQHPERALLLLAKSVMLGTKIPDETAIVGLVGPKIHNEPGLLGIAKRVATQAHAIARPTSGGEDEAEARARLRGAFVEQLVFGLVRSREPMAKREQEVELLSNRKTRRQWSYPKDVAADGLSTLEVYEVKRNPQDIDQADVDELADIAASIRLGPTQPAVAIVFLASLRALEVQLSRLDVEQVMYASEDELLDLAQEPARLTA